MARIHSIILPWRVPDLEEAHRYYASFGLNVQEHRASLHLYTEGHPHRWSVLTEGKRKALRQLSFGMFADDAERFHAHLEHGGIERRDPPADAESNGFWFRDPDGILVDGPGFHHCSWDVGSINDIGLGAAQMADKGFSAGWGLGRHVLGSNYFYYVRDPWGSWAEYSCDIDYVSADSDWQGESHAIEDSFFHLGTRATARVHVQP